jgi:hypothetical protein
MAVVIVSGFIPTMFLVVLRPRFPAVEPQMFAVFLAPFISLGKASARPPTSSTVPVINAALRIEVDIPVGIIIVIIIGVRPTGVTHIGATGG